MYMLDRTWNSCGAWERVGRGRRLASFPGVEEGKERAPGTHCLCMRVVIAKAMWQN